MPPRNKADFAAGVTEDEGKGALTDQIYGAVRKPPKSLNEVAKPEPIDKLTFDPIQPRRVMPSIIRRIWAEYGFANDRLPEVFRQWWGLAQEEIGEEIPLREIVLGQLQKDRPALDDPDVTSEDTIFTIYASLMELATLASSIRRDGQINAIKIGFVNGRWLIETGERRWMSVHLLRLLEEDPERDWNTILAVRVAEFNRHRQAAENNARQQLNGIGKARQFALLLMELLGSDKFAPFESVVTPGESDRTFYAQVADGEAYRIPRGKSEELLSEMGLKDPGQLRQIRALLRLSDELWSLADDQNWSERRLRDSMTGGDTVTGVTVSRKGGGSPPPTLLADPAAQKGKYILNQQQKQYLRELVALRDGISRAGDGTKMQAKAILNEIRRALDDVEKRL